MSASYTTIAEFLVALRAYKADPTLSNEKIIGDLRALAPGAQLRWDVNAAGDIQRVIFSLSNNAGFNTEYLRNCSGLVVSYPDMQVLSIGPTRVMRVSHTAASGLFKRRDGALVRDAKITPVYDGTCVTYYYYEGEWRMSSNNGYDVSNLQWISELTFSQAASSLLPKNFTDSLEVGWCYSVGFRHHEFHPLSGDPERTWFVCKTNTGLLNSDEPSLVRETTTPHKSVQPIAPIVINGNIAAQISGHIASHIIRNCRESTQVRDNNFVYGYVLTNPDQGKFTNIMIESSLLVLVKNAFYDAPNEVKGLGVPPSLRKKVILTRAYMRHGSILMKYRTEKGTHKILTSLHNKFMALVDNVCTALCDSKHSAYIATSSKYMDKVAHHYATTLRQHSLSPHNPNISNNVSDFIRNSPDMDMLYKM